MPFTTADREQCKAWVQKHLTAAGIFGESKKGAIDDGQRNDDRVFYRFRNLREARKAAMTVVRMARFGAGNISDEQRETLLASLLAEGLITSPSPKPNWLRPEDWEEQEQLFRTMHADVFEHGTLRLFGRVELPAKQLVSALVRADVIPKRREAQALVAMRSALKLYCTNATAETPAAQAERIAEYEEQLPRKRGRKRDA